MVNGCLRLAMAVIQQRMPSFSFFHFKMKTDEAKATSTRRPHAALKNAMKETFCFKGGGMAGF